MQSNSAGFRKMDSLSSLERVADDVKELGKVENMPKMEGRQMTMMIGPAAK